MQLEDYFLQWFDIGISFRDLELVHSVSNELNQQQTYREVKFLCWKDERYPIYDNSLSSPKWQGEGTWQIST